MKNIKNVQYYNDLIGIIFENEYQRDHQAV